MSLSIYIYIYIERDTNSNHLSLSIYLSIYIYISDWQKETYYDIIVYCGVYMRIVIYHMPYIILYIYIYI